MSAFPKLQRMRHTLAVVAIDQSGIMALLHDAGTAWLKHQDSYSLVLDAPWLIHLPKVFPW